ncbi:hypothetical protein QQ045_021103 [Rhodiola kirilowii]
MAMKPKSARSRTSTIPLLLTISVISVLYILFTSSSSSRSSKLVPKTLINPGNQKSGADGNELVDEKKYLYWGSRIDCPGKHCNTCAGLGHQESSLRCALEEAMYLQRTFVMPSRMCINPMHNKKGILRQSDNENSEATWATSSCAMDSLYDLSLMSETVPVILDNSKTWYQVVSTSMKLEDRGAAHVKDVHREDLKHNDRYTKLLLINRTAIPLSWFAECRDRHNLSAIMLPHSFLPSMAAKKLRDAAEKIHLLLGDYDAVHVRRGDILKTRKDRFGVARSLHPHLDRDTRPVFIMRRIEKWVPPGRTLFIASNERIPGFFSPLSSRYKLAYSSNFSHILEPLIENNYQLFMLERLILMKAKTFIKTYKELDNDLSLTDDPKKNTKNWQIPVYTMEGER